MTQVKYSGRVIELDNKRSETLYADESGGADRYETFWYLEGNRYFGKALYGEVAVRAYARKWGFSKLVFIGH